MHFLEIVNKETEFDHELKYRWSQQRANEWHEKNGWIVGCNYIPGTAINQLEMWQAESFDPERITKELSWAKELGFNTVRVFLHHLLWEQDQAGFLDRLDQFLTVAYAHGIKTMFVLFDAVWDPYPKLGKQPEPKPNIHNSGWVQSPGFEVLNNTNSYDSLRSYVQGVVGYFKDDPRVLIWDLFNEPDNMNIGSYKDNSYEMHKAELAMQLLKKTINWVRETDPIQPLTAAPWNWKNTSLLSTLDNYMFSHSDVITFHCYESKRGMKQRLLALQQFNRPLICTEYMARPLNCTFENILPLFKQYNVGAFNWGLVAGKTQTHCAWGSWETARAKEPKVWFHDIFRFNGEPYNNEEVNFIKQLTRKEVPAAAAEYTQQRVA